MTTSNDSGSAEAVFEAGATVLPKDARYKPFQRKTTVAGSPHRSHRALAWLVVLFAAAFFIVRGMHDEREVLKFRDFKQPYASARCLLKGCNPYSEIDTEKAFVQAGGVDTDAKVFEPYSALYPPFSFAVLTPIAALRYPVAEKVWLAIIAILFTTATVLVFDVCLSFGAIATAIPLSILLVTSTILLMLGQLSGPVIALSIIGLWCLLRSRLTWVAVLCLSLAAVLKPHDAALLILYLPFAGPRWSRAFLAIAGVCIVLVVAGVLWCGHAPASAHWLTDLLANLKGNSTAGAVNDPGRGFFEAVNIANIQALLAPVVPHVKLYNRLGYLIALILLGCWAVPAVRMPNSLAKHTLALGSMACITLLPIYHRQYDTRILLLLCPATAVLLAWRARSWGIPALVLTTLAYCVTAHQFLNFLTRGHHPAIAAASGLKTVLLYRPLPLTELILCLYFLSAFWAIYRASLRSASSIPVVPQGT
jgi:hypothetical protein